MNRTIHFLGVIAIGLVLLYGTRCRNWDPTPVLIALCCGLHIGQLLNRPAQH